MIKYKYLAIPILAVIAAQVLKLLIEIVTKKPTRINHILNGSGGMPSSHSAFSFSLLGAFILYEGVSSPFTALSFVFSMIVAYDAFNVRYEVGKHALILNKEHNKNLNDHVGHTLIEVIAGIILGLLIAYLFYKLV